MTEKIYRAPKSDKNFKKYWDLFLPQVVKRPNFDPSHLQQLEILCDLYLEYHTLTEFIKQNGYSFITDGRYGETSRPHVEVQIRAKTVGEIRAYTKMLGLMLDKGMVEADDDNEFLA